MKLPKLQNKRGASFAEWTEGILICLVFVVILGIAYTSLNVQYSKSHDGTFGLQSNDTIKKFNDLQQIYSTSLAEGQSNVDTQYGLTLTTAPRMVNAIVSVVWDFVTGSWIRRSVDLLNIGESGYYIALILQIIFFTSIIWLIFYILFKVIS